MRLTSLNPNIRIISPAAKNAEQEETQSPRRYLERPCLPRQGLRLRQTPRLNVNVAVLRATTHKSTSAPPEYRVAAILLLNEDFPLICVDSLVARLHKTTNAFVALKCLFSLHNIILQDWSLPRDSKGSVVGGHNELNVRTFNDRFDAESTEYSSWVRWYAEVLEENVVASGNLGRRLFYRRTSKEDEMRVRESFDEDLISELGALASLLERLANVPRSLHLQRNELVCKIVTSVRQDYRVIRRETTLRMEELSRRAEGMKVRELSRFLAELGRVEGCEERLVAIFSNKANNDGLWEEIAKTRRRVWMLIQERSRDSWVPRLTLH
ncbi:hypothetical protein MLD38_001017 [Melastoma candidum]|uniref:Uncharacterized protein n=1 Tax=Melastoma candidum TaxID=119954 RepID=A0ACB9SD87_9MYRT|nr:hypothetical protein MLD38_001017 [Melastoma candidum]